MNREKTDSLLYRASSKYARAGSMWPELMTEDELIEFLRIPEVSNAGDYRNVVENLKKVRGLPRIHICNKVLYPRKAVLEWIERQTDVEK